MSRSRRVPIISFFAGGGLLDLGLEQAGFSIVWTNENDATVADMYETGITSWRRSRNPKAKAARISYRGSIVGLKSTKILQEAFPDGAPDLFGVVGGPPCPDFSNGGTHSGHTGENGKLTKTFVSMICRLRPHFFVLENVAGLYHFSKHRQFLDHQVQFLRDAGEYAVDFNLLNALELGVPQDRERLFVVGCHKDIADNALGRRLAPDETGWFTWPKNQKYLNAKELPWPKTCKFGRTPKRPKAVPLELTVQSVLATDPEKVANGLDVFSPHSEKFWERDEGDVSGKSFKRLHRYRYSPTAWYGNQEVHLHPWKPRRLSVREALRLQTVPDEYVLPSDKSLSAKFKLVCNGVPCRMAELLGEKLIAFLRSGT